MSVLFICLYQYFYIIHKEYDGRVLRVDVADAPRGRERRGGGRGGFAGRGGNSRGGGQPFRGSFLFKLFGTHVWNSKFTQILIKFKISTSGEEDTCLWLKCLKLLQTANTVGWMSRIPFSKIAWKQVNDGFNSWHGDTAILPSKWIRDWFSHGHLFELWYMCHHKPPHIREIKNKFQNENEFSRQSEKSLL